MGEILGVGLSHYPPLCGPDDRMGGLLQWTVADESIPSDQRDSANWSEAMLAEWGDDEGAMSAGAHRSKLVAEFAKVRKAIDDFAPDALVIIGDDQYENFREGIIPPYTVLAYEQDMELRPWQNSASSAMVGDRNVWGEPEDHVLKVRMAPQLGRDLATGLLERGIDTAYAYKPNHYDGLSHAFTNALLFLDYERTGLDYPVLPFAVNCYGRWVISRKGFVSSFGDESMPDPPSPGPRRMMQVGAALAETILASDHRVALIASSSWSHAFLCDRTFRMRPDTPSDRLLYETMVANDFDALADLSLTDVEAAGQQEVLNWFTLWGAMQQADCGLEWSSFVETNVFNSNKVFAVYES